MSKTAHIRAAGEPGGLHGICIRQEVKCDKFDKIPELVLNQNKLQTRTQTFQPPRNEGAGASRFQRLRRQVWQVIDPQKPKYQMHLLDVCRLIVLTDTAFACCMQKDLYGFMPISILPSVSAGQILIFLSVLYFVFHCYIRYILLYKTPFYSDAHHEAQDISSGVIANQIYRLMVIDWLYFTAFYILTCELDPKPGFFVFYMLPATTAVLFLRRKEVFTFVILALLGLFLSEAIENKYTNRFPTAKKFANAVVPRGLSFFVEFIPLAAFAAISRSLRQREKAMEAVPDVFFFSKNENRRYSYASPGFATFIGAASPEEVLGCKSEDFFAETILEQIQKDDDAIFKMGASPPRTMAIRLKNQSRTEPSALITLVKLPLYREGRVSTLVGAIINKTRWMNMLKSLRHDFLPPLEYICNQEAHDVAALFPRDSDESSHKKIRDFCKHVVATGRFLSALAEAYGFIGSIKDDYQLTWEDSMFSPFEASEPLHLVKLYMEPWTEKAIVSIDIDDKDALTKVRSDFNKIAAITYMLVTNAIDAIKLSSSDNIRKITIKASLKECSSQELYLSVDVIDTGCGVSKKYLAGIASQDAPEMGRSGWESLKGQQAHSGFGLFIADAFAKAGGGSLTQPKDNDNTSGAHCAFKVRCLK